MQFNPIFLPPLSLLGYLYDGSREHINLPSKLPAYINIYVNLDEFLILETTNLINSERF